MNETPRARAKVGLIGVGLLGAAMAERLAAADFELIAFDLDPDRRRHVEDLGGRFAASAAEVARQSRRMLLSLPDSTVVSSVVSEIETELAPGTRIVDTTTGDPRDTLELAKRLQPRGVAFLDATVAGSSQQARQGDVLVMVGGDPVDFAACRDVFSALASRCFHVGPVGSGARMKLVVNLAIGLNRAVLAEALVLGEAYGFPGQVVLDVLKASPAYSRMMDTKGEKMVQRDFTPQARLRQHLKDVRLILAAGADNGVNLPLTRLHERILQTAVELGHGDQDNSAVLHAFLAANNERER